MSGKIALFDNNIIIYLSKRRLPLEYIDLFDEINISIVSYMEILGNNFHDRNEENLIRDLIDIFNLSYIDKAIADKVVEIRKLKRIKLPDAIIAATAMITNSAIVTRNTDDFSGIEIDIINPFATEAP